MTLRNYRSDGTMLRNALRLMPLRDGTGQMTHFVGFVRDVTHAAGVDRLAGLLDQYGLVDRIAAMDASAPRSLLLVKLNILRFHDVNSGFGYDVGDAILRSVAVRMATLPTVALARVGPNTFALAFELGDTSLAARLVDDSLELLKPRFVLPGSSFEIQFATGYAIAPVGADLLQMMRQAGAALQRSKAIPSHPPQVFQSEDERDARNRIRLATELQSAVLNQEMLFHYQPQFELISGKLVGPEALLRWKPRGVWHATARAVHQHSGRGRRDTGNRRLGSAHRRGVCGGGQSLSCGADQVRLQRCLPSNSPSAIWWFWSRRCWTRQVVGPSGSRSN